MCALPTKIHRNNHPMAVHTLTAMVNAQVPKKGNTRLIVVMPQDKTSEIAPIASAIAKAFPAFTKKTSKTPPKPRNVQVVFVEAASGEPTILDNPQALLASQAVAEGVMLAGRLVDTHPEELTTDQFAQECQLVVDQFPNQVTMTQIVGEDLKEQGYGGLYGVGKAATCPPRLVILEYNGGAEGEESMALVGKGIIYDTGGLSIKPKTGMCGMKTDMGGAAGLLGGFYAAVKCQTPRNIKLVLCLAENAIGPTAFRNDDILEMYSGKTVEVNNCDAEGRLVLGDGVAHVTQNFPNVNLIVDMATLTGAQLVATGKKHAGILCNTLAAETQAFEAGMYSGDLCFPLLYAPEILMDEFKSPVADMKNSVKDRGNAQTSCAGHFIEAHLAEDYKGGWIHVDMAGPAVKDQRGTGYGVGLVMALVKAPGF
uniref:Cytosol aminopeptidase domain-containing protein n=1 Tax=Asterionellopsis glacialis TaxID=33640 RepID=A0A7S0KXV5_9STRA